MTEKIFQWQRFTNYQLAHIGPFELYVSKDYDGGWVSQVLFRGGRQIDVAGTDSESSAKYAALHMLNEKLTEWQTQTGEAMRLHKPERRL